jgi:hypothetical protein
MYISTPSPDKCRREREYYMGKFQVEEKRQSGKSGRRGGKRGATDGER